MYSCVDLAVSSPLPTSLALQQRRIPHQVSQVVISGLVFLPVPVGGYIHRVGTVVLILNMEFYDSGVFSFNDYMT